MAQPVEMLGAEGVSRGIIRLLRARLPRHLARQRSRYSVSLEDLPDVDQGSMFTTPQPFASVEKFPALMVVLESTDGRATNRQESGSGSYDELVMQYRVQVQLYARGSSYSLTELAVQRYVLAVRAALIAGRTIGAVSTGNWGEVMLDRLREGYTDPQELQAGTGWLGGGWVEFHLQAHEMLWTDAAWHGEPIVDADPTVTGRVDQVLAVVHPAMEGEPE